MLISNRIVHGLWIGPLTRLERLTLHSFVAQGHEFHLWRYEKTPDALPPGVVARNANEIIPHDKVFRKREPDNELGLGAGSYATFSDLFRTKLLHKLGGIWVDMDILCLRPFDFEQPYVFRSHRLGAVMNVIKCPPHSPLMGELAEEMIGRVSGESQWFDFTLAFIEGIRRQKLQSFVRDDLMPPDLWESVQPFIEGNGEFNPLWFGLHWLNELWTTIRKTGGLYKGKRLAARLPDKNHPIPGTRIFQLYQQHGLLRSGFVPIEAPLIPSNELAAKQAATPSFADGLHINAILPSMMLGGAERLVHDVICRLQGTSITSKLFLLHDVEPCYPTDAIRGCQVIRLEGQSSATCMRMIAAEVLASRTPTVFTHMLHAREFETLGRAGVRVVPVIHNSQPGWQDAPQALETPWVPFIVAVSQAVKDQLLALGCRKPIVVVRHELQRAPPTAREAETERLTTRRRHGVPDDALLVGMVGQFKAQKAYTRAVRVLHKLQEYTPARLMILGGWDHAWGSGRAAYTAVCQQALELGVMADVITPGPVQAVEPYYSAFDVFLNTSIYEGLSIAMLEAKGRGCPVVTADAGGNAEALGATDVLIRDSSDIDAYVRAILDATSRPQRMLRPLPADDLVPRLWSLLGKYAAPRAVARPNAVPTTLVLTENLNIGGPQRALVNLLSNWPKEGRISIAVLEQAYWQDFLSQIDDAGILVFGLHGQPSVMERCERVLQIVEQIGATTLAFWNVPAALKLALAKVLEVHPLRLVDVSPGPMLRKELMSAGNYPQRLCLSVGEYFARVDCFVSKYAGGLPPEIANSHPDRARIIPNGVPALAPGGSPAQLPADCARDLAVGTCCRIVPSKRIEQLIDMMDVLTERVPGATLTIVGAVDPRHAEYAAQIADKIARAGLRNIHFVGPHADVAPLLRAFRVFVMLSDDQGCPNASLEAMAAGVPVVANDSGGTAEQVIHGTNGYLVSADDPREMASAVEALLRDPKMRDSFGAAARRHVERGFPMERMISGYLDAFGHEGAKSGWSDGAVGAAVKAMR